MQAPEEISLQAHLAQFDSYNPASLKVAQAKQIISSFIRPVSANEKLTIRQALGRILAEDIISGINVPAHDNSAMDGYALIGAELESAELESSERDQSSQQKKNLRLEIIGSAFAGYPFDGHLERGQCVRIMTGAVMPEGSDSVIAQEHIISLIPAAPDQGGHESIEIDPDRIRTGDNRRLAGEDLAIGSIALAKGKQLQAADLGLLASLGISEVAVTRKLRVAFFLPVMNYARWVRL